MRHLILTALLLTACSGGDTGDTDCPDSDRDDVCDAADLCLGNDATGDTDSDGICDVIDICTGDDSLGDADLDGVCDGPNDLCFGEDSQNDTDNDGVCNDRDLCVGDDALGDADNDDVCDGADDACFGNDLSGDTDSDGVCDDSDQCMGDDSVGDTDNDGTCDDTDICTGDDASGDADEDGVCNDSDLCTGNDASGDTDEDAVCDDTDACIGNDATGDTDNDAVCDDSDVCPNENDLTADPDNDGVCSNVDICTGNDATGDTDNDRVCNDLDQCFGNDAQPDTDGDGICEDIDLCTGDDESGDTDNDGTCDDSDACIGDDTTNNDDNDAYCNDLDQCDGDDALGDLDNDGLCNDTDPCVGQNNADEDGDGICNGENDLCDGDDLSGDTDGDGVCDDIDLCYGMDRLGDDDANNICGDGIIYHVVAGIPSRFHDGLTWNNAFRTPALAAEVAEPGDTVFVRSIPDGTSAYAPEAVLVNPDVQWIGGFQSSETHPDQRPTDRSTGLAVPTPHGDVRASDATEHWTINGGYVDAFEYRGYRTAAVEVHGESVLHNIVIAEENVGGIFGLSGGLVFQETNNARLSEFTCQGRDVRYNGCLTMNGTFAEVMSARFRNVSISGSGAAVVLNGGTLRINDMTTSQVTARLFRAGPNSELIVTNSDLSNITTFHTSAIVSATDSDVRFTDTVMVNNRVTGAIDIEGGLIGATRTHLALDRTHIVDTELVNSESIQGGVISVINGTTFETFAMRDSSIHGTSFDYLGSVDGGVIYLDSANTGIIGNTFGPLDSPFTDERVQGALLHLDTIQATFINNAMWTNHDMPIQMRGQQNLAWGALCAPSTMAGLTAGPVNFVELTATPFAAPLGIRLLLAPGSPCVDEGRTSTSDSVNIWWPGRVSEQGTSRDIAPVDLGAHYNP